MTAIEQPIRGRGIIKVDTKLDRDLALNRLIAGQFPDLIAATVVAEPVQRATARAGGGTSGTR